MNKISLAMALLVSACWFADSEAAITMFFDPAPLCVTGDPGDTVTVSLFATSTEAATVNLGFSANLTITGANAALFMLPNATQTETQSGLSIDILAGETKQVATFSVLISNSGTNGQTASLNGTYNGTIFMAGGGGAPMGNFNGSYGGDGSKIEIGAATAVPEPSSFALCAFGLVGFGIRRRRRR